MNNPGIDFSDYSKLTSLKPEELANYLRSAGTAQGSVGESAAANSTTEALIKQANEASKQDEISLLDFEFKSIEFVFNDKKATRVVLTEPSFLDLQRVVSKYKINESSNSIDFMMLIMHIVELVSKPKVTYETLSKLPSAELTRLMEAISESKLVANIVHAITIPLGIITGAAP